MRFLICIMATLCFSGCSSLKGSDANCIQNDVPKFMQEMLNQSCRGSQHASLEIGLYYEDLAEKKSDGDYLKKAVKFYRLAAASSSGQTFIYVPGAGKVAGYTMPVRTGPTTSGLAEAQYRLGLLYLSGNGLKKNPKKAQKYFRLAALQGHQPSCEQLSHQDAKNVNRCEVR